MLWERLEEVDAQQRPPATECENERCRGEVYHEEATYRWEGKELCPDCFKALVEELMERDLVGLALLMNVDVTRYV